MTLEGAFHVKLKSILIESEASSLGSVPPESLEQIERESAPPFKSEYC